MKASKTTEGDIELLVRATENIRFPNGPSIDTLLFSQNKQTFLAKVLSATYSPSEITLTCSDENSEFYRRDSGVYGSFAPVFLARSPDKSIQFHEGVHRQTHWGSDGQNGTLTFRSWEQQIAKDKPAATVWVFAGCPKNFILPDPIPPMAGILRTTFGERVLRCRFHGKAALLRALTVPELKGNGLTAIAVARMGVPPRREWTRSLIVMMSFIFGGWLQPSFQYTVDNSGKPLWQIVNTFRSPIEREGTPAIDVVSQPEMVSLGRQFSNLLRRTHLLFDDKFPFDVPVQHLLTPHDSVELEIRDICLAADSLAESPLIASAKSRFISRHRLAEARTFIDESLANFITAREERFRERVGEVLVLARTESTHVKQKHFWAGTHVEIGSREKAALKHRNEMSHLGYIPFDYSDEQQWLLLLSQAGLLRTMVNRAILAIMGYHGEAASYSRTEETAVIPARLSASGTLIIPQAK